MTNLLCRYVEFLHTHAEMEEGLSELAVIVEEAVKCGHCKVVESLFSCVSISTLLQLY